MWGNFSGMSKGRAVSAAPGAAPAVEKDWSAWGSAAQGRSASAAPSGQRADGSGWNRSGGSWGGSWGSRPQTACARTDPAGTAPDSDRYAMGQPAQGNLCGGAHMKWQDDFTGSGAMPLKGKHFNDEIIEKRGAGEILAILDEKMLEFSVVNSVTALHRIAKTDDAMSWLRDPRIKYLNRRILKMFSSSKKDDVDKKETGRRVPGDSWVYYIDTRSLTNCAWAFAKLDMKNDELLEAISEEVIKKIYDSSPQQLANSVWSFAKLLKYDEHMLTVVADEVMRRLLEFNGQHIMNVIWACAKLGFLHVDMLSAISHHSQHMLDDFTPQHLSITAWGYATLGFKDLKLMEAISQEVQKTLRAFRPQNIANTAWAFATLDLRNEELLGAISKFAIPRLHEYNQQHMSNLLWAFASLQIFDQPLMNAVAQEVVQRCHEFDPQGLSNIACSFALLDYPHQPLLEAISAAALARISDFNPRDLENLAYAYAKLQVHDAPLLEAIAQNSLSKLYDFNSLDLANTVFAYATLGIKNEALMDAIAARTIEMVANSFPPLAMTATAWAYSTLGLKHDRLFEAISQEVTRKVARIDLQYLVTLVDIAELPCQETLARRLGAVLYHILEAFPKSPEAWRTESYVEFLVDLKVDGFGAIGTQFLYSRMDINEPSLSFRSNALEQLRESAQRCSQTVRPPGAGRGAICALASYTLHVPWARGNPHLSGTMIRDLSDQGQQRGSSRWLQVAKLLSVGTHLDRALQPTYAIFGELCHILEEARAMGSPEDRLQCTGLVQLVTSHDPCVSCIGGIRQFQQLLPNIKIEAVTQSLRQ